MKKLLFGTAGVAMLLSLSFGISMLLGKRERGARQQRVIAAPVVESRIGALQQFEPGDQPKTVTGSRPHPKARAEVPLDAFRQKCWREDKPLPRYASETIRRISVAIPANGEVETPFDFCVEWVAVDGKRVTWGAGGQLTDDGSATLGTRGQWNIRSDSFTSWEHPARPEELAAAIAEQGPICIRGTAVKVEDAKYASMWGATLGLDVVAGDASHAGLKPAWKNIEIGLSGDSVPEQLRLQLEDDSKGKGKGKIWCKFVDLAPVSN